MILYENEILKKEFSMRMKSVSLINGQEVQMRRRGIEPRPKRWQRPIVPFNHRRVKIGLCFPVYPFINKMRTKRIMNGPGRT